MYQNNYYQGEKNNLTTEEIRCFDTTMRDFRREGLQLDDNEFIEMKKTKLMDRWKAQDEL